MYIDSGQFDELVKNILTAEYDRRKEEAEKENDRKLWDMYLRSDTTLSYNDWHAEIMKKAKTHTENMTGKRDEDMTDQDMATLLKKLFPNQAKAAPT
ncbi:MAG: hypothetical protein IKJ65_01915 [Clostridia bacterium]|nr:hypothetical protein [Clostridia bacterium]